MRLAACASGGPGRSRARLEAGDGVGLLAEHEARTVSLPDGRELTITALPAKHGPEGVWEALGPVIGFHLAGPGLPSVYVSGDNSQLDVVDEIVERYGPVDIAILFVGGAKFDVIADGSYITLSNERALEAAQRLQARKVVAIHEDSWAHFSQNAEQIREVFAAAGLEDTIVALHPGETADLD